MPRWLALSLKLLGGFVGGVLLLALVAVLILTQTDWGQERVKQFALDTLASSVNGIVEIGELDGNLLTGATLHDVAITDSAGAPLLTADRVSLDYSLGALLSQRILLSDVQLVNPTVVLDQPPGEPWNFQRIFPSDTTAPDTAQGGFGSWVRIHGLSVQDGRLLARTAWTPPDSLSGAARDSAIAAALSPESRTRVVAVDGGFQSIYDFRDLDARAPLLRLADPDTADIRVEVAQLNATALLFRPPAAAVRDLAGTFVVAEDSIHFRDTRLVLPVSELAGEGAYARESGGLRAAVAAQPVRLQDLQWIRPTLPDSGEVTGEFAVVRTEQRTRIVARDVEAAVGEARLAGHAAVQFGDSLLLDDTDLRFEGISTALIERLAPEVEVPVQGTARGRLALSGTPSALEVDGRVVLDQAGVGTSEIVAAGVVGTTGEGLRANDLRVRVDPLYIALLETMGSGLPVRGVVVGSVTVSGSTATGFGVDADLMHRSPEMGPSRVLASGEVDISDGFSTEGLTVRLEPVQLALARAFAPSLDVQGELVGRIALSGSPESLRVDADLAHRGAPVGPSRVLVDGVVSTAGGLAARNLRLRFDPLQAGLARAFSPDFPLQGTIAGTTVVTGSPDTRLAADLDLLHRGPAGATHLVGDARVVFGDPLAVRVDVRAPTLALGTLDPFAPAAQLRGTASGRVVAEGSLSDLALALQLEVQGGGAVAAEGSLALAAEPPRYDVQARFRDFDAAALTARAPATSLTGTVAVEGRGTELATADAVVRADLEDTSVQLAGAQVDSAAVDAARVLLRLGDGLLQVERSLVRLASAEARVQGSFGLVQGRSGELRYRIAVDSLSDFASLLPADSGAVQPRPAEQQQRIALARADSARLAEETEVERAATGLPPEPELQVDSVQPLPMDSLAGSVATQGVIAGNLERFDLRGTAEAEHLVVRGNTIGGGDVEYALQGAGTPASNLEVAAALDSVRAAGLALDSLVAQVAFAGSTEQGSGTAEVGVYQDSASDLRFRTEYALTLQRQELRLADVVLRFDTVTWQSTQPGTVAWGDAGYEVGSLELRSSEGGRIYADGDLPLEGEVDLELAVERLPIQQVLGLLQDTAQATGLLSLRADVSGTARAPVIQGQAALMEPTYGGTALPSLASTFDYADTELSAQARLFRQPDLTLLQAEARLPLDLALQGVEGERLLDRPLDAQVRIDSLSLESLPQFTDAVRDVRGRVRGSIDVAGTWEQPDVDGVINLDLGELTIAAAGVELREGAATLRLSEDEIIVDSLLAQTQEGPVRLSGTLDITTPTAPAFDLALEARGAQVLDNDELGELEVDADLTIRGPFENVRVEGEITALEGMIYVPESDEVIDLTDAQVATAIDSLNIPAEALPATTPLDNLEVDVEARVSRNVWVQIIDGTVEVYTPEDTDPLIVALNRSEDSFTLEGVVVANQGEYTLAGRRFELSTGTITFLGTPELDPLLQLTAVHTVPQQGRETLEIQVNVGGNLSSPTVSLTSNAQPPLPQSDLISYLVFGRSSSSLLATGSSSLASGSGNQTDLGTLATQQLAGLAIGTLINEFAADLEQEAGAAGLDVVRIFPGELPAEFRFRDYFDNVVASAQYEAGVYVNQRTFVAAHGPFTGWPGARVEYRTPTGFVWQVTWEPRYLPSEPSFTLPDRVRQPRVFGTFLLWERRF